MRITKREIILGAGGALALAAGATVIARDSIALFDSRFPESLAFAAEARSADLRTFDIAREDETLWRRVRAGFSAAPLVGVTRWSDWTILKGALETQGRRAHREVRLDCGEGPACSVLAVLADPTTHRASISGAQTLFAWAMR